MSPPLKSDQPGKAFGSKRTSPSGGAMNATSWRVTKIRSPKVSGNTFPNHGPHA